ncbi:hypothetical protein JTE90_027554 [Oedothorax gibbosus]|uniref:Uncharacterized protein n=1 Tax=Oedothorax gibbosus TaxID=931172 RepID=A0AAV6VMR2_9ARAC|nr:hypothetical protein JTE90_027554 [Oedothorax gibbosus]
MSNNPYLPCCPEDCQICEPKENIYDALAPLVLLFTCIVAVVLVKSFAFQAVSRQLIVYYENLRKPKKRAKINVWPYNPNFSCDDSESEVEVPN